MRAMIATLFAFVLLSSAAFAQVQPVSGNTVPVEAGKRVFGIIVYPSGMYTVGNVMVEGSIQDDMFAYWEGSFEGAYYYYDPYSMRWMPGPVSYTRASLAFQDGYVEGWVRNFGGLMDYNNFYGNDGDYYKRVNIYKRNKNKKHIKGRVVYTYFRNVRTGERSDNGKVPYIKIEGADVKFVNEESRRQENHIQLMVEATPELGEWQETARELPNKVDAPKSLPTEQDPSLMQLIEKELGPLKVGPEQPK
jgi:hypothetical protein